MRNAQDLPFHHGQPPCCAGIVASSLPILSSSNIITIMPSTSSPPESRTGLSLLDNSPLPKDVRREQTTTEASVGVPSKANTARSSNNNDSSSSNDSYESILEKAALWKLELESTRDEMRWLQVQNCQSLDALCMAGAEIAN